LQRKLVYYN